MAKIRLTKLDAARRQLATAIELWFHDRDPVAVHALVAAAYQVISDLLGHRGKPDFLYNNPVIRPERRRDWARAVKKPANFIKHADKDPEEQIELNVEINEFHILQCLVGLETLGEKRSDQEHAFWIRFALEYPDVLNPDDPFGLAIAANKFEEVRDWSRERFFSAFMDLWAQQRRVLQF